MRVDKRIVALCLFFLASTAGQDLEPGAGNIEGDGFGTGGGGDDADALSDNNELGTGEIDYAAIYEEKLRPATEPPTQPGRGIGDIGDDVGPPTAVDTPAGNSVRGAGGSGPTASGETPGYAGPVEAVPPPVAGDGGPTGVRDRSEGGPVVNSGAEFGPPVTPLPSKKPRFRCPKDLTYLTGRAATVKDYNAQYYNSQGGSIYEEDALNCLDGNLCCWNNAPFPRDQYQFQQVRGYVDPTTFKKEFNSEEMPESDFLIVKSPCSPDNSSSAELVSCTLGYVDNVTVTFRHWQTENVQWQVCTRDAFVQFTAETTLNNCQDIPAGNGPDSVTLPGGELFDIVIVATNFVDRKSEMAVISGIQVNYKFAEALMVNVTTTTVDPFYSNDLLAPIDYERPDIFENGFLLNLTLVEFEYREEYSNESSPEYQRLKKDIEAMLGTILLNFDTLDGLQALGWTGEYRYLAQEQCMNPWTALILRIEEGSTVILMALQPPRGITNISGQTMKLSALSLQANRRSLSQPIVNRQKRQTLLETLPSVCEMAYDPIIDMTNDEAIETLLNSSRPPIVLKFKSVYDFCNELVPIYQVKCGVPEAITDCDLDFCTAVITRCEGLPLDQVPWFTSYDCEPEIPAEVPLTGVDAPGTGDECKIVCSFEDGPGSCAYSLVGDEANRNSSISDPARGFAQTVFVGKGQFQLRRFLQNDIDDFDNLTDEDTEHPDDINFDPDEIGRAPNTVIQGSVLKVPFMNRVSGILRAGRGKYYGAAYVTANNTVDISVDTNLSTTRLISFQYYAATSGLIFKACCSDTLCPIQTESSIDLRYFRRWRHGRMVCPKGSDKIKFVCHATQENQGACGIDSIQVNYFDPIRAVQLSGLGQYPLNDACDADAVFVDEFKA